MAQKKSSADNMALLERRVLALSNYWIRKDDTQTPNDLNLVRISWVQSMVRYYDSMLNGHEVARIQLEFFRSMDIDKITTRIISNKKEGKK